MIESWAFSFFMAVDIMPVPRGFVRINLSPGFAVELSVRFFLFTLPVTTSPYFGTASLTVCPPSMGICALFTISNRSRPFLHSQTATVYCLRVLY